MINYKQCLTIDLGVGSKWQGRVSLRAVESAVCACTG